MSYEVFSLYIDNIKKQLFDLLANICKSDFKASGKYHWQISCCQMKDMVAIGNLAPAHFKPWMRQLYVAGIKA